MASHALPGSTFRERRTSLALMVAVTVIGLVCAFGPLWMVRVGLVVSLAGAATALWFAFREIHRLEALHRTELKAMRDAAALAAHAHHTESMGMIEQFTARYKAHGEQLATLRADLTARQQELSTLRGNLVSATAESDRRAERVTDLEAQLAARQAEIEALEAKLLEVADQFDDSDEIITLPRRSAARTVIEGGVPTAAELWSDGNHPTVVDLNMLNLPQQLEQRKQA
ncbi:hypothetical protein ACQB6R_12550 [Propionibacteriaceae bacterium G1746]